MTTRFFAAAISLLLLACAGPMRSAGGDADAHHVVSTDWFVATEPYQSGHMAVLLSSLVTAPSDTTKGEGEYMVLMDGQKIWAKYQYRTRQAIKEDLKVGTIVIVADKNNEGLYQIPENRAEVVRIGWFMGTITDLTDLYKNEVSVSGEFRVQPDALRVIVAGN